jgi:hypothetical protein
MKKHRIKDRFIEELKNIPIVQIVCEKLGVSRNTHYRWIIEDPIYRGQVALALAQGEDRVNDVAESNVIRGIQNGNMTYTTYWLGHRHEKFKKGSEYKSKNREVVFDKAKRDEVIQRWFEPIPELPTSSQNQPETPLE